MFNISLPPNLPSQSSSQLPLLKSLPLQDSPYFKPEYNNLSSDLQRIFQSLFNNQRRIVHFGDLLPFRSIKTKISICNKILSSKEISFRCFDCLLHEGSLICQQCFRGGNHNNHRYQKVREEGSCDCGNINILKSIGHCSKHILEVDNQEISINLSDKIRFELNIRQLFIWGFSIWSKININNGVLFLLELVNYLIDLNTQSLYYNIMTTGVLFQGELNLMSQLLEVCLVVSQLQKQLTQKVIDLLLIMYPCQEFKEKALLLIIELYNRIDWFQSSKFEKVLIVLLSDPKTIENVMLQSKKTLNPCHRRYNPLIYYKHLLMAEFLKPQIAELFLTPLVSENYVNSIVLARLQMQCEKGNLDLLSILSEHTEEQYLYYKVMIMTIGIIKKRDTLGKMIQNYYKMLNEHSFIKNTVILIPHRVLTLLIFKYFDFNITKIDFIELCQLIGESKQTIKKFFYNFLKNIVGCLNEFSLDLVRNTYFYNYRLIYISEESQIVMIDYLALKILAYLHLNTPELGVFPSILFQTIYREDIADIQSKEREKRKDYFDKWNKLLEVLTEIVYNPKVEIFNCLLLNQEHKVEQQALRLIQRICKKIGKIPVGTWQAIEMNFFLSFKKSRVNWIEQVLTFDKDSCKYCLKNDDEAIEDINFDRLMSLTHSKLAKLLTNQKPKPIFLDHKQRQLFNLMLDPNYLNEFLIFQLDLAKNQLQLQEMFVVIPETIRITKSINLFLPSQQLFPQFYQECQEMAQNIRVIFSEKYDSKMMDKSEALIADLAKLRTGQEENTSELTKQVQEEREKKKLLMQMKKEKLMKERKMKQNQEKYIGDSKLVSPNTEAKGELQECLICKEKSQKTTLCYLAKARLNNTLFELNRFHQKHMMFYSCLHMVHFSCFSQQVSQKKVVPCPLCYSASNMVLPHEAALPSHRYFSDIYKHALASFSNVYKHTYDSLFLEGFIFLAYSTLINLEKANCNEKEVKLCHSVFKLMLYQSANYANKKKDVMEEFRETNNFNLEKDPKNMLRRYLRISQIFIDQAVTLTLTRENTLLQLSATANHEFNKHFSPSFSAKTVSNFLCFLSNEPPKEDNVDPAMIVGHEQLIRFKELPSSLLELFQLRDNSRCKKSYSHVVVVCILCGERICSDCEALKKHTEKVHLTESLFFNLDNGGLKYCHLLEQIVIQSLFVNKMGILWHPETESKDYFLDRGLLRKLLEALTAGNLFYFITHTYVSLKEKNIPDII